MAKADAVLGNSTLAKLAQEKVNALEKILVQLNERNRRKISSVVWQNGSFCEAVLVLGWKKTTRQWGKCMLRLIIHTLYLFTIVFFLLHLL
jgi:hypothetical protein